jgi:hypothetical protein
VKTIVLPTAMLRASIVVVNHTGIGGGIGPEDHADRARSKEDDEPRHEPAHRAAKIAEHQRAERG